MIKDFLETTRGCKFHCDFCTIPALSGGRVRRKPVEDVVVLIKKMKRKYRIFTFLDNNIYNDPSYARALFKALRPLKIKWGSFCTIDIAKNDEVLKLAKESGCQVLTFGYEISESSNEKDKGGKFAMARKYLEFTRQVKKAGIRVKGNFVFGFDSDKWKSLFILWKFCFQVNPLLTGITLLTPLPGTRVYEDMLRENRILNLNWHDYGSYKFVFKHKYFNNVWMTRFFSPCIPLFFMLTTSKVGYAVIFSIAALWTIHRYYVSNLF